MGKNNEVHVVIDSTYTATVRDLKSFEKYLENEKDVSLDFGQITHVNDECCLYFLKGLCNIIESHKKKQ